jgi:hypothetical protein
MNAAMEVAAFFLFEQVSTTVGVRRERNRPIKREALQQLVAPIAL